MKKYIYITIHLILSFLPGKAQDHLMEYGVSGGPNFNTAFGTAISKEDADGLIGYSFGVNVKMNLSQRFGVKALLQYDQIGWAYRSLIFENSNGTGFNKVDALFKMNYLNLPVVAEYTFGNKTTFYTNAGIFFGVLLNSKTITKQKEPTGPDIVTQSTAYRKSTNAGITLGAGMQMPVSSDIKLGIGLHNNLGLKNISKSPGSTAESTIKTNSLSILAGITYSL